MDNLILKATGDERNSYRIPAEAADLSKPFNAEVAGKGSEPLLIKDNIIRFQKKTPSGISMAQRSNLLPPTAKMYENVWRKRSIGILSGEDFSFEDEAALLCDWADPQPGETIVDLGCSTAFYARSLFRRQPDATQIAVDFSLPMLEEARSFAESEKANMYLLQADASALPLYGESVDAVVCGGSLNEFSKTEKVLWETKRILKPGGRAFFMYLLKAETLAGKLLQAGSAGGGISFWTEKESEKLFADNGFETEKSERKGVVCFQLFRRIE